MTIQALIFLSRLRFVQMTEDGEVYFPSGQHRFTTVTEVNMPSRSLESARTIDELKPMIEYLIEKNLLTARKAEYLHLTYSGFHYAQTLISMLLAFLFRSIAVPILVSILTTLITMRLKGI